MEMTLRDLLEAKGEGLDTGDKDFDIIVTAEYITKEEFAKYKDEPYYKFAEWIYNHIKVVDPKNDICDYTGFVEKNMTALRNFSKQHWRYQYPDPDDFTYEWIGELHGFLAGNATDQNYSDLLNCLNGSNKERKPNIDYSR